MLVKGIHHVSLTCTTIEQFKKAVHFYTEILNLSIYRQWGDNVMLRIGEDIVEIFLKEEEKDLSQGAIRHFAFATDDVDACIERVRREGYKISVESKDVTIPSVPNLLARVGFCIGPVGEEIEFFQVK